MHSPPFSGSRCGRAERSCTLHAPRTRSLDRSDRFYQMVLDGVRDYAIFALDAAGTIVSWNAGAERLSGYTAEDALGRAYADLFAPGSGGVPADPLAEAHKAGHFEVERWWRTRDGGLIWVNELITDLTEMDGDALGFAVVTRDLTERRKADERQAADRR